MLRRQMPFPERLRYWQQAKGVTSAELARRCDVSRHSVHQWRAGASAPRLGHLVRAARALGISLDALVPNGSLPLSSSAERRKEN